MRFRFVPHTADEIFEAYGDTLEEAFSNAALAMQEVMTDTSRIEPNIQKRIEASGDDLKALLYDFLEKFLILKDVENLVFSEIEVQKIERRNSKYHLTAIVRGEEFDPARHEDRTVVKAVTYHEMEIGQKQGKKFVRVLVDI